jgi:hypothetical protein
MSSIASNAFFTMKKTLALARRNANKNFVALNIGKCAIIYRFLSDPHDQDFFTG